MVGTDYSVRSVSLQASRAEKTEMIEEVAAAILLCLETDSRLAEDDTDGLLEEDDYHQTVIPLELANSLILESTFIHSFKLDRNI